MASPIFEGLPSHYQSLGVATSTHQTYQAGVRAFQQFCYQFEIPSIPASPLTLHYFCCSIAQRVSHKTIKVYLTGICLEHLERGCQDPTNDYSLLEKMLLWSAFTLAFYSFLRASEFATPDLSWSNIQLNSNKVVVFIQQSKTDPFCNGHTITISTTDTSTCPVRAITQYAAEVTPSHQVGPLFNGGRYSPLTRQHLTSALRHLLQNTEFNQQQYASHSFRIGAATTAAAGLPEWLIKMLGRWKSNAFQSYIHPSTMMLQSVPSLIARTDTSHHSTWDPDATSTPAPDQ